MELILFAVLATIAVVAALGMLLSANAVHSALYLIVNFGAVAVMYLLLQAPFIALAQVTVYAGAIMVLFLFVIMLLGAERLRRPSGLRWQQRLAVALGAALLIEAGYLLLARGLGGAEWPALGADYGGPQQVGEELFSRYLLPFEVTSVLLLVGMIGAIVLARDERSRSKSGDSR